MNDTVDFLTVAPVLPGTTPQVVFTVNANAFGSGCACALGVVGLSDGQGDLDYYWSGDWGASNVQVKKHLLSATASYWTPSDPHGSPVRTYDFSVRVTAPGVYTTVKDTRPWLGVYVRATRSLDPSSPVTVVQVVPDSPAAAYLRPGDVLVSIQNAPTGSQGGGLGPDIYDQLARFLPGQTAHVLLRRGASLKAVDVRLGSMADVSARNLPSAPDGVDVL
jgi:hypothetical protein